MLIPYLNLRNLFLNRFFVLVIVIFIFFQPQVGKAMLIASTHERPGPGYYKAVLTRLYTWYNKEYFDFDKRFSSRESKLVHSVIEDIDKTSQYLDPKTGLPRFRLAMDLVGDKVSYGNLWISFPSVPIGLKKHVDEVLKSWKIADIGQIYGIEWSFENDEVSLFSLVKGGLQQDVYKNKKQIESYAWQRLEHVQLEGNEIFALGIQEVWEVKSEKKSRKYIGTDMFPSKEFNEVIKSPLVKISKEFGLRPQFILFQDRDHFRIYYQ
ncbi:MAG: hypothetical protein JNL11_01335 [Bdellovibrionaceae bacterium]|nr:hypothetical protein [Pseudobdellovibrionaceae bacterium]